MKKKMLIVLIACALLFGGIFGFKWFVSTKITEFIDNMEPPTAVVTTAKIGQQEWFDALHSVGTVKAVNGIALTSQVAGVVTKTDFQSGEQAHQGDLLIQLDDKEDRAGLQALTAAAHLANQDFNRVTRLYKKGSVSKAKLDQARSQRDQAKAQMAAQQARVNYKNIKAPFDGQLGIRLVDLGQFVSPGTPLVMLQSISPIYVNFSLPEQDLSKIKDGLEVSVTLDSAPGISFKGTINAIDPGVDPDTRNVNVQAVFDNVDRLMRPGMFAAVDIALPGSRQLMVIPGTAVKFNPYGDSVFVVTHETNDEGEKTSKVVNRFVKLGQKRGDVVVVLKGLEVGDEVVTSGLLKLRNNAAVEVDNSITPPSDPTPHPDNS